MSKVPRLYLPPSAFSHREVRLEKAQRHYLANVLRLRTGQRFAAMDGAGKAWLCEYRESESSRYVEDFPASPPHGLKLTVGVALCKGSRFENALERLAELGVERFLPLHTARTERKAPSANKLSRWRQIAESASALAYRQVPMLVEDPVSLTEVVKGYTGEIGYCHPGGLAPGDYFVAERSEMLLLVGPEGGFDQNEASRLGERATQIDLGSYNLRVETAAALAAGLALQLWRPAQECDPPAST